MGASRLQRVCAKVFIPNQSPAAEAKVTVGCTRSAPAENPLRSAAFGMSRRQSAAVRLPTGSSVVARESSWEQPRNQAHADRTLGRLLRPSPKLGLDLKTHADRPLPICRPLDGGPESAPAGSEHCTSPTVPGRRLIVRLRGGRRVGRRASIPARHRSERLTPAELTGQTSKRR